ncbi:MAG: exonuclease domain-containing protein, partial [Bacteroidales bacterium]
MIDFIAIKFNTATSERNSICEVGIAVVENDKIVSRKSGYVKHPQYPYFDDYNANKHKITAEDITNAPTFAKLLENELKPIFTGKFIIAYNAGHTFSLLRHTLDFYDLPYPKLEYACISIISRNLWKGSPSYDLESLCKQHNISMPTRSAEQGAVSCAELSVKAFQAKELDSVSEIPNKLNVSIGQLLCDEYKPCNTIRTYKHRDL